MTENFKNQRYFRQFAEENRDGIAFFTKKELENIVDRLQVRISNYYTEHQKKKRNPSKHDVQFPPQCHNKRLIVVTKERIGELLRTVIDSMRMPVGDIYFTRNPTRRQFIHTTAEDCTFHYLVENVSQQLFSEDVVRNSWDPWATLYGEKNPHGLRAHSELKIKEKRPIQNEIPMMF